ncbi:MAG TPA: hypothetical protein VFG35_18400 [Actinoplanes sp.]|nr:hypothetical protein [Actinoplanes sp.]
MMIVLAVGGATSADWLEAWSTFAAAVVGLAAAVFTLWLLLHQIAEARRARSDAIQSREEADQERDLARRDREFTAAERRENEKAQARTVLLDYSISSKLMPSIDDPFRLVGVVTNFGDSPVLDVDVFFEYSSPDEGKSIVSLAGAFVMSSGEKIGFDVNLPDPDGVVPLENVAAEVVGVLIPHVEVVVEFTDIAGRRWRRGRRDDPERVTRGQ